MRAGEPREKLRAPKEITLAAEHLRHLAKDHLDAPIRRSCKRGDILNPVMGNEKETLKKNNYSSSSTPEHCQRAHCSSSGDVSEAILMAALADETMNWFQRRTRL